MKAKFIFIIGLNLCLNQAILADVFHVSPSGSDPSGDGSPGNPWKTLKHAVANISANAGHTIQLSSGTFVENGPINVPAGISIAGAGIGQTIIKAASSFYYNPSDPGYSLDKYLIRLHDFNPTFGNQSLRDFKVDGDSKQVHGGIYIHHRSNILIERVEVENTNFNGIWLWNVQDSELNDIRLINCSWGSNGYSVGALNLGHVEGVTIDNAYIDEDTGYGIKAIGPGGYNNIYNLKIINSYVTVNPVGLWNNGSAPNIAIELWQVDLIGCEIAHNYVDNTISLVNSNAIPPRGVQTIRVHHNTLDMLDRAGGAGYGVELTIHDAEVDHNYFLGGTYGIANWDNPMENWEIHHNTFYKLANQYPGEVVRSQWSGLHNVNFYNNTIEFDNDKTMSVFGVYGGTSENIEIRNNLIIDSQPNSFSYYPSSFIHLENGGTINNLEVRNNLLDGISIGDVPGSYSNNQTDINPQITAAGSRPEPYYLPNTGSPLIDAGIDLGFPFQGIAPDIGAYEIGGQLENTVPVVSIVSPIDNSGFSNNSTIAIEATASDPDGSIAKVEFFNQSNKLGEDTTSPYSFNWTNVQSGTYYLNAVATDNADAITVSEIVTVVVSDNQPPVISFSSPTNNSNFSLGESIPLTVSTSDPDGSVQRVEYYSGSEKIGENYLFPYEFTWSNAPQGNHSLTAVAFDNSGVSTISDAVNISVISTGNVPPVVALTEPTSNTTFSEGEVITLSASASDPDGTITKVEFFNGSTKLSEDLTSPYSYSWNGPSIGSYNVSALATDNTGSTTQSQSIVINITTENQAPSISLTNPIDNSIFTAGETITVSASASDPDGTVTKVEFFSGNNKLFEDSTSPYNFSWNNAPLGDHDLVAQAMDNDGLITQSQVINMTVAPANLPPTVALVEPVNNNTFLEGDDITLIAEAADPDGSVNKVEFYVGETLLGEDNTNTYSLVWPNVEPGNYIITVKAQDNNGIWTTSEPVRLDVLAKPQASTGIVVGLDAADATLNGVMSYGSDPDAARETYFHVPPGNGTNYYLPAPATATFNFELQKTSDYIVWARVKTTTPANSLSYVYDGKGKWFFWSTFMPEWTWVPISDLRSGEVHMFAFEKGANAFQIGWAHEDFKVDRIAITDDLNYVPSDGGSPSGPFITSPQDGQLFSKGEDISISVNLANIAANVSRVEFYNGPEKISEEESAPYTTKWSNLPVGDYAITARVVDNLGNDWVTQPVQISVVSSGFVLGLDASDAVLQGIMAYGTDTTAGQDTYFYIPPGNGRNYYIPPPATATFNFEVPSTNEYTVWARVKSTDVNNQSYYIYDGKGKWYLWNAGSNREWTWKKIVVSGKETFTFEEGTNWFQMAWNHENVKIDRLYISSDINFHPEGLENSRNKDTAEDLLSDLNATPEETELDLYPNPASDRFTVRFNSEEVIEKARLIVTNLASRELLSQDINIGAGENQVTVNVETLETGIYLVTLLSSKFTLTKRLMISK